MAEETYFHSKKTILIIVSKAQKELVPLELDKKLCQLLIEADSMIGHLSHRCGIKWNDLDSINQKECDELCLKLRRVYEL